ERPRAEHAEAPGVRQMVVGRPAGELEQRVERLGIDRCRVVGLVRPARADQGVEVHPGLRLDHPLPMTVSMPSVLELWRWPVKGMAGERMPSLRLDARGVGGDRSHAVLRREDDGTWTRLSERQ